MHEDNWVPNSLVRTGEGSVVIALSTPQNTLKRPKIRGIKLYGSRKHKRDVYINHVVCIHTGFPVHVVQQKLYSQTAQASLPPLRAHFLL